MKIQLSNEDLELARALFAVERYGNIKYATRRTPPPLYQVLAYRLRNSSNRAAILKLLKRSPKPGLERELVLHKAWRKKTK